MTILWVVFAVTMLLSYLSEKQTLTIRGKRSYMSSFLLLVLVVIMSLHCGLRTAYNDTFTYIRSFQAAPTPAEYLANGVKLTENPLFYLMQCFFRHHISDNYHLFFVCIALATMGCFVSFIRRYSHDFTFSMLLFYTLLYLLPFGAMKQALQWQF